MFKFLKSLINWNAFFVGMASVLDIGCVYKQHDLEFLQKSDQQLLQEDWEKIGEDWKNVGEDIDFVIKEYKNQ